MKLTALVWSAMVVAVPSALAQNVPAAIYTDPAVDHAHPAAMEVLHIPTHGVSINGIIYTPSGQGPHPTVVICHGFPGNEKNLDLAQAIRRAGWNAVTFNYRGAWGSPGAFHFAQNPEDADAVLAYLRDPANAAKLGIDTKKIVLAGHSMGGWVTVLTAAHDHGLAGVILISAADMGLMGTMEHDKLLAETTDSMEGLAGTHPGALAEELARSAKNLQFSNAIDGLARTRMLVLSANDGLAPQTDALVKALEAKGNKMVKSIHAETDHSWSDHRIFLESAIIEWLSAFRR